MLLADTSAWHRAAAPGVAQRWAAALAEDLVATTAPSRLEVLYSARSAADYEELAADLDAPHQIPCGQSTFARAEQVQLALGRSGGLHHRSVKLMDLLIAAAAETAGATVWHYDEDYDRIAAITGQPTEWIAPRGSL